MALASGRRRQQHGAGRGAAAGRVQTPERLRCLLLLLPTSPLTRVSAFSPARKLAGRAALAAAAATGRAGTGRRQFSFPHCFILPLKSQNPATDIFIHGYEIDWDETHSTTLGKILLSCTSLIEVLRDH
ncbi:unnamed protein product [Caretta caretta]